MLYFKHWQKGGQVMKTIQQKSLDNLYCDAINAIPQDFDFSSGFAETWDTVYPNISEWTVKQCYDWLEENGYDTTDYDAETLVYDAMMESGRYCPMMNYIYSLPNLKHSEEEAQRLIEDTNCVIVLIDGSIEVTSLEED